MGNRPPHREKVATTVEGMNEAAARKIVSQIQGPRDHVRQCVVRMVNFFLSSKTPSHAGIRETAAGLFGSLKHSEETKHAAFALLTELIEKNDGSEKRVYVEGSFLPRPKQDDAIELLRKIPGGKPEKLHFATLLVNFAFSSKTPGNLEFKKEVANLLGDVPSTPENKAAVYKLFMKLVDELHPEREKSDSDVHIIGASVGEITEYGPDSDIILSEKGIDGKVQPTPTPTITIKDDDDTFWNSVLSDLKEKP